MRKETLIGIFFFIFTGWTFGAVSNGKEAPDFQLKGHDGKVYRLSQFRGKNVILEWYNNDCPYVDKHYSSKNMQELQKEMKNEGVVWLSIISSAPGKQGYVEGLEAKKLVDARGSHQLAILLDPEGKVGKLYGAKTTPHMFYINQAGILKYQGAIDDQPSTRLESLKGAKNYIRLAHQALKLGKLVDPDQTKAYGCSVKY